MYVRDSDREHARRREALHESPRDELPESSCGRRQTCRNCQERRRRDDDALESCQVRHAPDDRRGNGDGDRRCGDREADRHMRCVEDTHQQRQEWLGRVQVEERREARKHDREDRRS